MSKRSAKQQRQQYLWMRLGHVEALKTNLQSLLIDLNNKKLPEQRYTVSILSDSVNELRVIASYIRKEMRNL